MIHKGTWVYNYRSRYSIGNLERIPYILCKCRNNYWSPRSNFLGIFALGNLVCTCRSKGPECNPWGSISYGIGNYNSACSKICMVRTICRSFGDCICRHIETHLTIASTDWCIYRYSHTHIYRFSDCNRLLPNLDNHSNPKCFEWDCRWFLREMATTSWRLILWGHCSHIEA